MKAFEAEVLFEKTGGALLFGRGLSESTGLVWQQADFNGLNLKIFDMADPSAPINGANGEDLVVADVIFNAAVTNDPRCSLTGGYNFLYKTKATDLPQGGRRYRFEFEFDPADPDTDPYCGVFEVPTLGLYRA